MSRSLRRLVGLTGAVALVAVPVLPSQADEASSASHPAASNPTVTADPGDYYDGTEGLSGQELKDELHRIISNQTVLSYDEVWDGIKDVDEDPQDTSSVRLLYSDETSPKDNNGGGADNWNREHVWAKSHGDFGTSPGPGTDLHHLRPTDVTVNSTRGNLDFDNGGTEVEEAPGNYVDEDSWEPHDTVKGDVARMIFYMAVRYEDGDQVDLEVNDEVNNGSAPLHGKVSVLKEWHEQDPPDAFEERRNELIQGNWQGNRNPFVDNPEWVDSIF